jgi:hypothetical protein
LYPAKSVQPYRFNRGLYLPVDLDQSGAVATVASVSSFAMKALPADAPAPPGGRTRFDSAIIALMSSRKRAVIVAAVIAAVPVLYALAAGPLVYLRSTGRPLLSDRTFAVILMSMVTMAASNVITSSNDDKSLSAWFVSAIAA